MLTGAIGEPDPGGGDPLLYAGGGPCTLVCLRAGRRRAACILVSVTLTLMLTITVTPIL